MNADDKAIIVEEYKSLRSEIEGYQRDGIRILEMGLVLTAALFAIATSEYVDASLRWLVFLTPWLIIFPLILLMTQRVRQTWKIGRYIETCLEPRLDFNWERYQFRKRSEETTDGGRKIPPFIWTSTLPLIAIQIFAVTIAMLSYNNSLLIATPPLAAYGSEAFEYNSHWKFFILSVFLISVAWELDLITRANRPDEYAVVNPKNCREHIAKKTDPQPSQKA